jgi:hypothetical protein
MFQTKASLKFKKQILYSQKFFPPRNRTVYELMWKNIIEPDRSPTKIRYDSCSLRAEYVRLQTHSENM